MLIDMIAASMNEGVSWQPLRRFFPKTASREYDMMLDKFGASIYRDVLWDERAREAVKPPYRSSIAWPIKRASQKVVPFRSRAASLTWDVTGNGFWGL